MKTTEKDNKKAYEIFFDYFYDRILDNTFKINDKAPTERELSEELGMSRNTIREGFHMLEMMGIIECIQGSGNYIRVSPKDYLFKTFNLYMKVQGIDYTELFDIRKSNESTALHEAMDTITDEQLEEMRKVLEKLDNPESKEQSNALDIRFHQLLIEASHNRLLDYYNSIIFNLIDSFVADGRTEILANSENSRVLSESHWNIYRALKEKNFKLGEEALEQHFMLIETVFLSSIKEKQA